MPDHKLSSALLYYIIYIVLSIMLADVAALRTGRRILRRSLQGVLLTRAFSVFALKYVEAVSE